MIILYEFKWFYLSGEIESSCTHRIGRLGFFNNFLLNGFNHAIESIPKYIKVIQFEFELSRATRIRSLF